MKQCLNFRIKIPNRLTSSVLYDNQACVSSKDHRIGDIIHVWMGDYDMVEAEVYCITYTSRTDFRWKLVGEE